MTSAPKKIEVVAPGSMKRRALLVDDNYEFFSMIKLGVEQKMFLDYAPDGFSALHMVRNTKYDIIICDVYMPYLDGIKLLTEFTKKHYDIPFILITGSLEEKVTSEAFQAGAYNVLQKPFKFSDLFEKIELAITLHQSEKITDFTEQEKAHTYNLLKTYYYDVEKIMLLIQHFRIPISSVQEEIAKKARMGKCIFDDLQNLKYYHSPEKPNSEP